MVTTVAICSLFFSYQLLKPSTFASGAEPASLSSSFI
jgi:hypothetical protein